MSDEPIPPALTPQQWVAVRSGADDVAHYYHTGEKAAVIAAVNDELPDDDSRKITREKLEALRQLQDWVRYLDAGECPKCEGNGFKMRSPPICIQCGWTLAMHPEHMMEQIASLGALESYLSPT